MKQRWLNFLLHFSGVISGYKNRLAKSSGLPTIGLAAVVLLLEIVNFLIAFPAYLFIAPQSAGTGKDQGVAEYRLRRIVSLSVLFGGLGLWALKIGVVALVGLAIGSHGHKAHAEALSWNFNQAAEYVYDPTKIEIVDGLAVLKARPTVSVPVESPTPSVNVNTSVNPSTNVNSSVTAPTANTNASVETSTNTSLNANASTNANNTPAVNTNAPVNTNTSINTNTSVPAPSTNTGTTPLPRTGLPFNTLFVPPTVHAATTICQATIQPLVPFIGINLKQWTGFTGVASLNGGHIEYQLSIDSGLTWLYWSGSAWVTAGADTFSSAADINSHMNSFPTTASALLFKAKMSSDCQQDVQLISLSVSYDRQVAAAPTVANFNLTTPNSTVTCTNIQGASISTTTSEAYINVHGQRIAHVTLKGNLDLSTSLLNVGNGAVLVNIPLLAANNVDAFELLLPKATNVESVRLCPTLTSLNAILPDCPGAVTLSATSASTGAYALVNLNDPDFWHIQVQTTGIIAVGATQIEPTPVVSTPTIAPSTCGVLFSGHTLTGAAALGSVSDYSLAVDVRLTSTGSAGLSFRNQDSANFWQLLFTNGQVSFAGQVSGQVTAVQNSNVVNFVPELNVTYHVKLQANGSALRAKWWRDGDSQPTQWLLYAADQRLLSGGLGLIDHIGAVYSGLSVSTCMEDQTVTPVEQNQVVLSNLNHAPEVVTITGRQQHDDGFVGINFTLKDAESNFVSLTDFEYSLTGAFTGEQKTMTLAADDTDHQDIITMTASPDGVNHRVVWNAAADVGDVADPTVYIRLRPSDSIEAGAAVISAPFSVDVKKPVVSTVTASQQPGTDRVVIQYAIVNEPTSDVTIQLEQSLNGGQTWQPLSSNSSGDIGLLAHVDHGTKTITWDAGQTWAHHDQSNVKFRVTATDAFKNQSASAVSENTPVDTKAPYGLVDLHGQAADVDSIQWAWSPVAHESNFDHYQLWYGTNQAAVAARQSANISQANNPNLGIMGMDSVRIDGLQANTIYYAVIVAYDRFGHETSGSTASYATLPIKAIPIITNTPTTNENTNVSVNANSNINTNINTNTSVTPSPTEQTVTTILGPEVVLPPTASNPPRVPSGGFTLKINTGASTTIDQTVTLQFNAGADVHVMAISNFADVHDAIQEPYQATKQWDLCAADGTILTTADCAIGTHTVYVKFFTALDAASNTLSDTIQLLAPAAPSSDTTPTTTVPGTTSPPPTSPTTNTNGSTTPESTINGTNQPASAEAPAGKPTIENTNSQTSTATTLASPNTNGSSTQPTKSSRPSASIKLQRVAPVSIPLLESLDTAKESPIMARPKVDAIHQSAVGNTIALSGTTIPNSHIALFLHSDQVIVYGTVADKNGNWRFTHLQDQENLAPGKHTLFAVAYDPGSLVKSKPSAIQTFEVKRNWWAVLRPYVDWPTTSLTVLVAMIGVVWLVKRRSASAAA